MPLGVSEGLIEKAYGPIDYSGFYKSIDSIAKKAAAEDALEKKSLLKDYYATNSIINGQLKNVRGEDTPEITSAISNWKKANMQLISNPDLVKKNPELYGKLTNQANENYTQAQKLIADSKEELARQAKELDFITKNSDLFQENAHINYMKASKKPTSQLVQTRDNDIEKLKYIGPQSKDLEKLTNIYDKRKTRAFVTDATIPKYGATVQTEFEIPDVAELNRDITTWFGGFKNPEKAGSSIVYNAPDFQQIKQAYNNMPDIYFAQFKTSDGRDVFPEHVVNGIKSRKPQFNFDSKSNAINALSYLQAKGILGSKPEEKGQKTIFAKGDVGKAEMKQDLALDLQKQLKEIAFNYSKQLQKSGAELRLGELAEGKELESKLKLLQGLIGTEAKLDISFGTPLDMNKLNDILGKLQVVSGLVSGSKKTPTQPAQSGKRKAY